LTRSSLLQKHSFLHLYLVHCCFSLDSFGGKAQYFQTELTQVYFIKTEWWCYMIVELIEIYPNMYDLLYGLLGGGGRRSIPKYARTYVLKSGDKSIFLLPSQIMYRNIFAPHTIIMLKNLQFRCVKILSNYSSDRHRYYMSLC